MFTDQGSFNYISVWIFLQLLDREGFGYLSRIGLPTNLEIGSGAPGRPLQQGPSSKIFEDKDKEVNSVWT